MTAGNQEVVGQISKALQATLDQNETVRKQAESFLQQHELSPGFLSLLLGIVSNSSEQDVNITAAIYLKNAITRNWKEDHCNFNQKDCEYVYTNLVKALVGANSGVKKQILTLTVHLSDFTRVNQWGFFKDFCALVEKGANENNYQILDTGLGAIAELCSTSWRNRMMNEKLFSQIKFCLQEFLGTWVKLITSFLWPKLQNAQDVNAIVLNLRLMKYCVSIGHSLCCIELPDEVEEAFKQVMGPWLQVLGYTKLKTSMCRNGDVERLLNETWTELMHIKRIMANQYEEATALYAGGFLPVVWELIPALKSPAWDSTVIQCLKYLSAMVKYETFFSFRGDFNKMMDELMKGILIETLVLDEDKIQQFQDDPGDFITQDLYASDVLTRRRCSIEFIRKLCESTRKERVLQGLLQFVSEMVQQYSQDRAKNHKQQFLASDFMIGMAVRGQTRDLGVTRIEQNACVDTFFNGHILPEVKKPIENPLVFARCVRFLNMFRIHLPPQEILEITFKLSQQYLTGSGEVISSYIAMLIGNLAKQETKEGSVFVNDRILQPKFGTFVGCIAKSFTNDVQWVSDVHRIKALLFLCERCKSSLSSHVDSMAQLLTSLIQRSAKSSHNPEYTYYLYETFGTFITAVCSQNSSHVERLEQVFSPILFQIIQQRKVEDVIPFAYQIMALMLNHYQTVPAHYGKIFDFAVQSGNDTSFAVPFLNVYMTKVNMFSQKTRLQDLFTTIQKLLSSPATVSYGIDIADAVLRNEAISENHGVATEVFKVIMAALQSKEQKRFVEKDFSKLLIDFLRKHDAAKLRMIVDSIQNGFYEMCVSVILKYCQEDSTFLLRRKFVVALISLVIEANTIRQNPKLWKTLFEKTIILLEQRMRTNREEDRLDKLEAQGDGGTSSKNHLVRSCPFLRVRIPSTIQLKLELAKAIGQLNQQQVITGAMLVQLVEEKYLHAIKDYCRAVNVTLN